MTKDIGKPEPQSGGIMLTPYQQAKRYANNMPLDEMPRYIVTCNFQEFRNILEERKRKAPKVEPIIDGKSRFLFFDNTGKPTVAMHWEHYFNHMVKRHNEIFKYQLPNITSHVCRHTYCTNMAVSGISPKTLQYLMGHSDIGVTLNTYTHLGLEDAAAEMARMEAVEAARREQEKLSGESEQMVLSQKMFKMV